MAIDGAFWIHLFESEKFGDTLLFKEGEAYLKAVVRESLRLQVETFVTKTLRPESRKCLHQVVCNASVKIKERKRRKTNSQILIAVKKMTKIPNFSRRPLATSDSCACLSSLEGFTFPGVVMIFAHLHWVFNISKEKNTSLTIVVNSQSCKDIVQFSPGRRHKLHSCTPSHVAQVTLLQKEPKTFKFDVHTLYVSHAKRIEMVQNHFVISFLHIPLAKRKTISILTWRW